MCTVKYDVLLKLHCITKKVCVLKKQKTKQRMQWGRKHIKKFYKIYTKRGFNIEEITTK